MKRCTKCHSKALKITALHRTTFVGKLLNTINMTLNNRLPQGHYSIKCFDCGQCVILIVDF